MRQQEKLCSGQVRVSCGGRCFLHGQGFPKQVAVHAMNSLSRSDSASLQEFLVPLPDLWSVILPDHGFVSFPPSFFCTRWSSRSHRLSLELLSQMSHWGFPFLYLGLLAEMWQHSWSHNCVYCLRFFSHFAAFYEYSAHSFPLQGAVLFPDFSHVNTVYF